ncbi:phage terminase family protein [Jiella marina]|uniref:phage terminase family protein n=1 Tax=Jiella sp. LLJ827 TaxID=2917712 RepID=UPI002100C9FF|nr:phage terminase family protein [Jiella sp. LLJ827]
MNILQAIDDPHLFAPWFADRASFKAWRAFLAGLFGLSLTDDEREIFERHTGRSESPVEAFREAWLVIGRRGGKSLHMALIAVFLACFHEYRQFLAPGERATVMVIAADRKQARVIVRFVGAMLRNVPMLNRMIERDTSEGFDLTNRVTIEVGTASYRSTRGYSYAAVLCDEIAFWRTDDAAEPDYAILDAIRPGMSTIPTSVLLCASSPYARRGALWDAFKRYHGKDDTDVLVWQASTKDMNPSVMQSVIDAAYERDPASAAAEYGGQFRRDIEAFLTREIVEACLDRGVFERPPIDGVQYQAFVDPSGGSADSFTLAIGHRDGEDAIIDAVRERKPPFSPEAVVEEYAALLKSYRIAEVQGDRYAGQWPRERFQVHGIQYDPAAKPKSDLYREMLPALNGGRVSLVESERVIAQLVGLERRTARGGRDSIDHAPGGHDDVANAVAGLIERLLAAKPAPFEWYVSGDDEPTSTGWKPGISGTRGRDEWRMI